MKEQGVCFFRVGCACGMRTECDRLPGSFLHRSARMSIRMSIVENKACEMCMKIVPGGGAAIDMLLLSVV